MGTLSRPKVATTHEAAPASTRETGALLSVTEVADRLGITRAGVQDRIDSGSLPAVRVGNAWAIPAAAVASD